MSLAKWAGAAAAGAALVIVSGAAWAQSPATCSFNAATATVSIAVDGVTANVSRTAAGVIRLNGVACGGANVTNTDTIQIAASPRAAAVMLQGQYAPGKTPEGGGSEIEIALTGITNLTLVLGGASDVLVYTGTGTDVGGDGDDDITGVVPQSVRGGLGDDYVDFSLTTNNVSLYGQDGDDHMIGGSGPNVLSGQAGSDVLEGNGGNDRIEGGDGDDVLLGGDGLDTFDEGLAANGADLIDGGPRTDLVDYGKRTGALSVTMSAGGADDGEAGEGDEVTAVENLNAGAGDDVVVGTSVVNIIEGRGGNDQLFGLENHDHLLGGPGDDYLQGDAGRNTLRGEDGNDVLVGNATSDDRYFGGNGDDEIVGNTDGIAENVDCGAGVDTVEPNDEDNFTACEGL